MGAVVTDLSALETVSSSAVKDVTEERATITIDARSLVSATPMEMLSHVPSGERREQIPSKTRVDRMQYTKRIHPVSELQSSRCRKSVGIRQHQMPDWSYFEEEDRGRRVPMRVKNDVSVIDLCLKDFVNRLIAGGASKRDTQTCETVNGFGSRSEQMASAGKREMCEDAEGMRMESSKGKRQSRQASEWLGAPMAVGIAMSPTFGGAHFISTQIMQDYDAHRVKDVNT